MLHPHPPEGIRSFAKHLFATFLGLLMALGLEQWREHRHERKATQEAMEAVHEEMERNLTCLDTGIRRCQESQRTLQVLLPYLEALAEARRQHKPLPTRPGFGPTGTGWPFYSDAWSALKSMGLLRNLPAATVRVLSRAYGSGEMLDRTIRLNTVAEHPPTSLYRIFQDPACLETLEPARIDAIRDYLQDLGDFFRFAENEMNLTRQACLETRNLRSA